MRPAPAATHSPNLASSRESIRFEDWKGRIQAAADVDEVVRVARSYCECWTHDQLEQLPWLLTATPIEDGDSLVGTAVLASRAELKFDGSTTQHRLLREMALTLAAAASRLRALKTPDYQH